MQFITGLLASLPRNMTVPVIVLLAGWYGGAKYGAPDYVMNSVDDLLARGGSAIGGFLTQDSETTDAEDDGIDSSGG